MTTDDSVKFARLTLEGWRQFDNVDLELHPSLTVITGANGAGKSSILNIFAQHFGYQRPYLATPLRDEKSGGYRYFTGVLTWLRRVVIPSSQPDVQQFGELEYTNGKKAIAQIPRDGGIEYRLSLNGQEAVQGFHVSSHRRLPVYQQVGTIPTQPMLPRQAYDNFSGEATTQYSGGHTGYSSMYRIKEALLAMAVFGPGSKYVQTNEIILSAFEGFVATLRKILPEEIGFIDISIRTPDVVIVTKSGDFLVDAASGGLMALVDLAWQIYMFSLRASSFVVTIDEPENHLHPSMQRSLLGNLIRTFPQVQFIVATHSPFIVSAQRDARVYVLRFHEHPEMPKSSMNGSRQTRFVSSVGLDSANRAGNASQILRDVLGLPTTYPEWIDEGVGDIIRRYRGSAFDDELLKTLRADLDRAGYADLYPDVVSALVKT